MSVSALSVAIHLNRITLIARQASRMSSTLAENTIKIRNDLRRFGILSTAIH